MDEEEVPINPIAVDKRGCWLAPDGTAHWCAPFAHGQLTKRLGFTHELTMERLGWIKLLVPADWSQIDKPSIWYHLDWQPAPTQAQINVIFDWCTDYSQPLPKWLLAGD